MIDFRGDLFSPGGKHDAPKNIHPQDIGDHLSAVITGETRAMLQEGGPKIVEADQNDQRPEALHGK